MSNWLVKLLGGRSRANPEKALYEALMERSLSPALYEKGLAEDTFEGRFEAVTLHSALLMRALRQFGAPGKELADGLYKRVFDGFDHALRERGAGDSSIARKIRGLGERYFGLARAVDVALQAEDPQLELKNVLVKNAIGGGDSDELATYLRGIEAELSKIDLEAFQKGGVFIADFSA